MKEGQKLWTRDEVILVMNLYCKIPFGKMHHTNPDVIKLATLIGRTPDAVAFKLGNLASFDPSLQKRGIKGASNASKLDKEIWNEFYNNWEILPYESEQLLATFEHTNVEELNSLEEQGMDYSGKSREQIVKVRVNQAFFRKTVLASYNNTCCITGINQSELLIAGHIRPWGLDEKNRLNPRNGIAINALHDKAFDAGLMTITTDFKIKISSTLFKQKKSKTIDDYFLKLDNQDIILPSRFLPDIDFLKYHNEVRFKH